MLTRRAFLALAAVFSLVPFFSTKSQSMNAPDARSRGTEIFDPPL